MLCTLTRIMKKHLRQWKKALTIELTRESSSSFSIAFIHNNIGIVCYVMKQNETAVASFERAIDIPTSCLSEQKKDLASFFENLERAYPEIGNFDGAIHCCTKLLALKLEWDPSNSLSLAKVYSRLAFLNFRRGKYQGSIENLEKVVEIHLMLSPVDYNLIVQMYNDLAYAFFNDSNYAQALIYYERALETEQKLESPRSSLMASTYNYMGNMHYKQNNYELSIINYTQAIKIYGEDTNFKAIYFDNLGGAYEMADRYDEAIDNYTLALEIKLKCTPLKSITVAQSYAYLGRVYFSKENYQISINNYQKAIEISLSITPVPASLISWYNSLSEMYYTSNDFEKAQFTCESALQKEQLFSNLDPLVLVKIYEHLSWINYLKGNYEHNTVMGPKGARNALDAFATEPSDHMIGVAFNNIGKTLFRMGVYDESLANFRKAIDIYSKSIPTKNSEIRNTYKNLGELFEVSHQFTHSAKTHAIDDAFLRDALSLSGTKYSYLRPWSSEKFLF